MRANEFVTEEWSQKYKRMIDCSHPRGFSQRAHCAGKRKHNESVEMEMTCPDCGMCQTHGNLNEIKKGQKDANGYTRCWPGKHAEGTKRGKNGGQVRNCVPNESVAEGDYPDGSSIRTPDANDWKQQYQQAVMAVKNAKTQQEYEVASDRAGRIKDLLASKGIQVGPVLGQQDMTEGKEKRCMQCGMKNCKCPGDSCKCKPIAGWIPGKGFKKAMEEAAQKTMSRAAKGYEKYGKEGMKKLSQAGQQNASKEKMDAIRDKYDRYDESVDTELVEEFNLIESIINRLAEHNQVDAEVIWEDLESLTEDELYAFAVTSQLNEDWQKANKRDKTSGMSQKAVMPIAESILDQNYKLL